MRDVSLALGPGDHVGLVGANGVGKSTLLRCIRGQHTPDTGTCWLAPGTQIGYLPQSAPPAGESTLGEVLDAAAGRVLQLDAELRALERALPAASGEALDAALARYGDALDAFERLGGYDYPARLAMVLAGLHVAHLSRAQRFESLSGGEKTRVGLALVLLASPDLLLLDEPTNHLDQASLEWLESYLASFTGAALMVSHDREFLSRAANAIIEIDEHTRTARRYAGGYDSYAAARAVERRTWVEAYQRQQEAIQQLRHEIQVHGRRNDHYRTHSDNDKFVLHGKRQTHDATVARRVRAAEEKLARMEQDPIPPPPEPLRFQGRLTSTLGARAPVVIEGVSQRFGERVVLDDISLNVPDGARMAIVGPNGVGKTTLLQVLAGRLQPDRGARWLNPGARLAFMDQEAADLDLRDTVFTAYRAGLPQDDQPLKALLLRLGLFRYDELDQPAAGMSMGQRRKLQLARVIAGEANLLILDEPTNFLALDVLESVEHALRSFPGAVVAASHDRRFLRNFGAEVWALEGGRLVPPADRFWERSAS